jgi:prevent-host-death family protein
MVHRVTATRASRNFAELLGRVQHHGDRFVVVKGGVEVAVIGPPARSSTLAELLEIVEGFPPDPALADDLERIQAEPLVPGGDPWGS